MGGKRVPKGYWIPHLDVNDFEGFKTYSRTADETHKRFGSRLLVRAGRNEVVEGKMRSRNVLREFESFDAALACYRSPDYQRAKLLRQPHSVCDFLIVEGYDGTQPAQAATAPAPARRRIAHIDLIDPEGYKAYVAANAAAFGKFAARFLVRAGRQDVMEGKQRARAVVLEFPSYDAALACYRSPEYRAAAALRRGKAEVDLVVIEQWEEPKA
jgi:uncharacterized protein (DUF1330 family)